MDGLELTVVNKTVGVLETNIEQLEVFVKNKLQEYTPDNYIGNIDDAKKDRAELNNSKKFLTQKRIEIVKELMKPYEDFENRCKKLEKLIDTASSKLDEIVKAREESEKETKKNLLMGIWKAKNFDLFPLEKVFNPKWLNKTFKKSDIEKEMDAIIEKTYSDLKIIEKYSEDAETLKALYLEDLNLEEVFSRADELQKNREKLQREQEERASREKQIELSEQNDAIEVERIDLQKKQKMASLVAAAMEEETPELDQKFEWVISVTMTEKEMIELKQLFTSWQVKYNSVNKIEF